MPGRTRTPSTAACAASGCGASRTCCSPTSTPTTSRACPGCCAAGTVAEIGVSPLPDPPGQVDRGRPAGPAASRSPTRRRGSNAWPERWPGGCSGRRASSRRARAPNNASVVLLAEVRGVRILLTGDVEPPAQAALRRAEPGLRADVLKIPHHGSAHQEPEFLASLGARVAIASAGRTTTTATRPRAPCASCCRPRCGSRAPIGTAISRSWLGTGRWSSSPESPSGESSAARGMLPNVSPAVSPT